MIWTLSALVRPRKLQAHVVATLLAFAAVSAGTAAGAPAAGAPRSAATRALQSSADSLRLTGHYEEARKAYVRATAADPVAAAIGVARCFEAVGSYEEATEALRAAASKPPGTPDVQAELARIAFARGRYDDARRAVDSALALDPEHVPARWIGAELDRVTGRLDEANDACRWFIRYYNAHDVIDNPEMLHTIGLAAAQYARWNRNSGQFGFLVNTLYPRVRKRSPLYWPAALESALLFAEKYNRPEALRDLEAAMAVNPRAAEVLAARAALALQTLDFDAARGAIDSALAINPKLVWAHQLDADRRMLLDGPRAAIATLEAARTLNPADEETLGRLAAAYGATDGLREDPAGTRMGAVIDAVVRRNPHCGTFFAAVGESFDRLQKYPQAARWYEESRRRMPQLITVPGQLGMVYMRLGDEARADVLLEESFELDPFNVRVANTRKVLDLLESYGTIETPHFIVRYDPAQDSLLAAYAARHLEDEIHPEIVRTLGFTPPGRSLFEIFGRARGTSGHGWFSMRMAGLPFIGTVGACAGKIVALASPNDMRSPYHWARVLKHEFVHVVNLQQTDFNIPHWFTEGLAVHAEGDRRPPAWAKLLAERAAAGTLFDLETINLGFVRPSSSGDWTLAYCQAELYVEYMASAYGADAPSRMITAYAGNLDTPAALKRCFGVDVAAFERGYRKHLDDVVKGLRFSEALPPPGDLAALTREVEQQPKDPEVLARTAYAFLHTGLGFRARTYATSALAENPRQPLAAWVLAQIEVVDGDTPRAIEVLSAALDPAAPDAPVLRLLADLHVRRNAFAAAESLCRVGAERYPDDPAWNQLLAGVYRGTDQKEKLAGVLAWIAERDVDAAAERAELAQLALDGGDATAAARWAREWMYIDIRRPDAHALLARALAVRGDPARAIEEFDVALSLAPDAVDWRMGLAEACVAARQPDRARAALDAVLAHDPNHEGAKALRRTLGR